MFQSAKKETNNTFKNGKKKFGAYIASEKYHSCMCVQDIHVLCLKWSHSINIYSFRAIHGQEPKELNCTYCLFSASHIDTGAGKFMYPEEGR